MARHIPRVRRQVHELLESRRVFAVLTVNTLSDVTDNTDGQLTLREAIAVANASPGADTIEFVGGLAGTISLRDTPLTIRDPLTIHGPGSQQLGIDGSQLDPTPDHLNGDGQSAIIVTPRATNPCTELHLQGLAIFNADRTAIDEMWGSISDVAFQKNWGAIKQGRCFRPTSDDAKWLDVSNSFFYQNLSDQAGAITATNLRVDQSVFIQNEGSLGGALWVDGPLQVTSSNFLGNLANDDGGAIFARGGVSPSSAFLANNSFVDNKTRGVSSGDSASGGALALRVYDQVSIIGSTFSANQIITRQGAAIGMGAAIDYSGTGSLFIEHSTIADNFYSGPLANAGSVGGISFNSRGQFLLMNSILAGNDGQQFNGALQAYYSLVSSSTSATLPPTQGQADARGNLVGSVANPLDAGLTPLSDQGNYLYVHFLNPDSPARNAGDPLFVPRVGWLGFDQRGFGFRRVLGGRLDMGSIETALPQEGDVDHSGQIDSADVDVLCAAIRTHVFDPSLDLNRDGMLDDQDLDVLIHKFFRTHRGDANLDGIFDSSDLVQVFGRGEYEDGVANNSTWKGGDWNCDGEFDTRDLVAAFQEGAYVATAQPRFAAAPPSSPQLHAAAPYAPIA